MGYSTKNKKHSRLANMMEMSRHPLASILFGFILTCIAGQYLGDYISRRKAADDRSTDQLKLINERNMAAASDISRALFERRERAVLLLSSIKRGAPSSELDRRKIEYDEAYFKWNTAIKSNLFTIRQSVDSEIVSSIDNKLECRIVPMVSRIDSQIETYYAQASLRRVPVDDGCNVARDLMWVTECGNVFIDLLFSSVSQHAEGYDASKKSKIINENAFGSACDAMPEYKNGCSPYNLGVRCPSNS